MVARHSVLIVDDDRFLIEMYTLKFKEAGFEVEGATSGEEALEKLRGGLAPDVVLLDVIMPGLDGLELLARVQKDKLAPKSSFIVLSNQSQDSDIARARELGATSYIVKASAVPSEVLHEVEKIISQKS